MQSNGSFRVSNPEEFRTQKGQREPQRAPWPFNGQGESHVYQREDGYSAATQRFSAHPFARTNHVPQKEHICRNPDKE